jgi:hypothetical protein
MTVAEDSAMSTELNKVLGTESNGGTASVTRYDLSISLAHTKGRHRRTVAEGRSRKEGRKGWEGIHSLLIEFNFLLTRWLEDGEITAGCYWRRRLL